MCWGGCRCRCDSSHNISSCHCLFLFHVQWRDILGLVRHTVSRIQRKAPLLIAWPRFLHVCRRVLCLQHTCYLTFTLLPSLSRSVFSLLCSLKRNIFYTSHRRVGSRHVHKQYAESLQRLSLSTGEAAENHFDSLINRKDWFIIWSIGWLVNQFSLLQSRVTHCFWMTLKLLSYLWTTTGKHLLLGPLGLHHLPPPPPFTPLFLYNTSIFCMPEMTYLF